MDKAKEMCSKSKSDHEKAKTGMYIKKITFPSGLFAR